MTSQTSRTRRTFPLIWSAALLALAIAGTVPAILAAQSAATTAPAPAPANTTAEPAWPANAKVIQAKVAKIAIPPGHADNDFPIPQLRVYDKEGRRVLERLGYYAPTFSAFLTRALSAGSPPDASQTLAGELDLVLTPDGKPIAINAVPEADYTLVDYWASWCAPCRAQDRDLIKVLSAKPNLRVNLVRVEADLSQKTPEEIARMIEAARASAAKKTQG